MRKLKVIIVDDEKWALSCIESNLLQSCDDVEVIGEYYSYDNALNGILEKKPDAVFADICIGAKTGIELMTVCNSYGITSYFVFISGHAEFTYAQQALNSGALFYLLKPVDSHQLRKTVDLIKTKISNSISYKTSDENKLCYQIIEYIRNNFADSEKVSLTAVAEKFYLSPTTLSEVFAKEFGETFVKYRNRIRLEHAQYLLKTTSLPIAQIAEMCGFRDASYFNVVFKQKNNITPLQFRGSDFDNQE